MSQAMPSIKKSKFNIFHGDCCEIMRSLRQQGQVFNHIITDPPYAISQKNSFHTMKKAVTGVNFGDWDWGVFPAYCAYLLVFD